MEIGSYPFDRGQDYVQYRLDFRWHDFQSESHLRELTANLLTVSLPFLLI